MKRSDDPGNELVVRGVRRNQASPDHEATRPLELRLRVRRGVDVTQAREVEVVRGELSPRHLWDLVEQVMDVFPLGAIDARH